MTRKVVRVGTRDIAAGTPCFLVAEIGINHNGDIELAKKMIDAAAEAGADGVKFQNYHTEDFIFDKSLTYQYLCQGKTIVESQYEMFKRCELTTESLYELKAYSDRKGVIFHSTPTSKTGIKNLVEVGTLVLKNGSDYLTHLPLIRSMGKTSLPTVLSTGMATLSDIDDAVRTFRDTGNDQLILLHCTSSYPTPFEDVNLRRIPALSTVFDCLVGFSDHTEGVTAAIGAVALGACWVEKHFTLDKDLLGPDHRFSANPKEWQTLVAAVRATEKSLGTSSIAPSPSEMQARKDFRLSCVAARDLPVDYCLTELDIEFQRPGTGLPPKAKEWLVRRQLKQAVVTGHVFTVEDFV